MKLSEYYKRKKEIMTPFRWKVLTVGLPVYLIAMLAPAALVIALLAAENDVGLIAAGVWMGWLVAVNVGMLVFLRYATTVDVKNELERYAYLFKEPRSLDDAPLTVLDDAFTYTLTSEGVKLEIPAMEEEQVFDEARENVFHIEWKDAELALATQSEYRHVFLALAVIPTTFDENSLPFFIPLTEDVYAFIKKTGIEERIGSEWDYLLYNPQDAFKQLVLKGRIVTMRCIRTGKLFVDKQGNFIGDE